MACGIEDCAKDGGGESYGEPEKVPTFENW